MIVSFNTRELCHDLQGVLTTCPGLVCFAEDPPEDRRSGVYRATVVVFSHGVVDDVFLRRFTRQIHPEEAADRLRALLDKNQRELRRHVVNANGLLAKWAAQVGVDACHREGGVSFHLT